MTEVSGKCLKHDNSNNQDEDKNTTNNNFYSNKKNKYLDLLRNIKQKYLRNEKKKFFESLI